MNRRFGISILSVLSLTVGLLVAEHAFAPLRAPDPITGKSGPRSVAEPIVSPRETAPPPAPANSTNPGQQPSERRNTAGEADGDPMVADGRPVIDSVWQNVDDSPQGEGTTATSAAVSAPAVTLASTGRAGRASGFGGGLIGVGGSFSGDRQARGSAGGGSSGGQGASAATNEVNEVAVVSASAAPASAAEPTATAPLVVDATPAPALNPASNPVIDPAATLAMNTPTTAPVAGVADLEVPMVVAIPPTRLLANSKEEPAPTLPTLPPLASVTSPPTLPSVTSPTSMLPSTPGQEEVAPTPAPAPNPTSDAESLARLPPAMTPDAMEQALAPAPTTSLLDVPAELALTALPKVSVPEPLSGSLLVFGVLLGVLSHRRRRLA